MADRSKVLLAGSQRPIAAGARALGAANADEWIELTIKVRRKDPLPHLEGRPATAMSRAQVVSRFGAAASDLKRVSTVLARFGLRTLATSEASRTVRVAGTAAQVEGAFDVRLVRVAQARGAYRGRVGTIRIPSELAGIVVGVFGLDNRPMVKQKYPIDKRPAGGMARATARPWFYSSELASVYDFPPGDGAGQTVAIIEFGGGYFPNDLKQFCQYAGVAVPKVDTISLHNAPTNKKDGAEDEVMLDIEVVAGVCPKAKIAVYFSKFTEQGWIDAIDAAVHDAVRQPSVVSISWGWAEDDSWSTGAIDAINESLKDAALLGVTVCVASGDDGSDDGIGDGHAHCDFPASSPYVLAVGGTSLRVENGKPVEKTWKDGDGLRKDGGGATGGGVSTHFARPQWQKVSVKSVNPGSIQGRVIPDVAADASASTGYFTVVDGQAGAIGGTSAAAPLWAALIARVNAKLPSGKRVGYLAPMLYQKVSKKTIGATSCRDITTGDNISAAIGGYRAKKGFDAVTGWGVPIGSKLAAAIAGQV